MAVSPLPYVQRYSEVLNDYIRFIYLFIGWIVSFLIDVRHGGPSSGYVSAGFFGGLMLGRVLLLWVTKVVGEQRVLYLYSFIVMGLASKFYPIFSEHH